ncbi:MAG: TSUP family transporter [Treponema sp.]
MALSVWATAVVCFFVFLAGFVDAAAGGGGLISLPAYLFVGLPVHYALSCNKFSAACGCTFAALRFLKKGVLEWKIALTSAFFAFFASFIGTKLILLINQEKVKLAVVVIVPLMAVIILAKKNIGGDNYAHSLSRKKAYVLAAIIGSCIGFYDGLIGPGSGTICIILYCAWMKYDLRTSVGNAKILFLASTYASAIAVILSGKVIYSIAVPAALCGIVGNYLGAGLALNKGAAFIRPLMLVVLALLFVKLFYDVFGHMLF